MGSGQVITKWNSDNSNPIEDIRKAQEEIKKASGMMAKAKTKKKETEYETVEKSKKQLEAEYYLENKIKTNSGKLHMYAGHSDGLKRLFNPMLNEAWLKKPHGETQVSLTMEIPITPEEVTTGFAQIEEIKADGE